MAMRRMISVSRRGSAGIWSAMGRQRALSETNPRLSNRPYPRPTSSRGAAIRRHAAWRGGGGALRPGLHPGLGRLREPPWGYYGPCARSLARRGGAAAVRRQACDDPLREAGAPCPSAIDAPPNGSAARSFQERRQAERHGACGWWLNPSAPHPGSTEAARYPKRLAALRCPSSINARGNAGGDLAWVPSPLGGEGVCEADGRGKDTRRCKATLIRQRCALPPSPPRGEGEDRARPPLNPPSSSFRRRQPSSSGWQCRRP